MFVKEKSIEKLLETMLNMQAKLNDSTNGIGWRSDATDRGRNIDWYRCIYMETAEYIDSYNWKHWKDIGAPHNLLNAEVELVDVWHFILSIYLRDGSPTSNVTISESLLIDMIATPSLSVDLFINKVEIKSEQLEEHGVYYTRKITTAEKLMRSALDKDINGVVSHWLQLCNMEGLDIDKLYGMYMAKNILNRFRQDHGYADGSYIKNWVVEDDDGMSEILEDNEVIMSIIHSMKIEDINEDVVVPLLEEVYQLQGA